MSKVGSLIFFIVGAAIGSAVTWKLTKTKYETMADEEIKSVKEAFSRREAERARSKPDINTLSERILEYKYPGGRIRDVSAEEYDKDEIVEIEVDDLNKPYVINPENFGEIFGYDTVCCTYYADGVLTNEFDEVIEDVDDVIGLESLKHFGEYEDDSLFVRNDQLETDYDIVREYRKYSDLFDDSSHSAEEE